MPSAMMKAAPGRRAAIFIFLLALAATTFVWWREMELVRRGQLLTWQEGWEQLNPVLSSYVGQRFESLRDTAKATLLQKAESESSWKNFVDLTEWQQRFPGMLEIGYVRPEGNKCLVEFAAGLSSTPLYPAGFDLNQIPSLKEGLKKCMEAGHGLPSPEYKLTLNSTSVWVNAGFIPMLKKPQKPGTPEENRANVRGIIFFVLNRSDYFEFLEPQLSRAPISLRFLTPDEPTPERLPTSRPVTVTSASGNWRFETSLKGNARSAQMTPWIVLAIGVAFSSLLCWLFLTQARLRFEAEAARRNALERDAEITALNRDLEGKIVARTSELNDALEEEKELNRLKSNFISMVTHEIRTPLALILTSSDILARYPDRISVEKRQSHLQQIDQSVRRMSALMEDVLLFSKADAGRMEFRPEEFDLEKVCRQFVDEVLSATDRRCRITIQVNLPPTPARGDETLIRHVVCNLLSNAIKYSPEGSTVDFRACATDGNAVLEIQDHGIGIPEKDQARLFTPFHRATNAATVSGTGLGLVIVQRCVERHGGTIKVVSTENVGTKVTVCLPVYSPSHTEFMKKFSDC
jgi:signal transduction histidine kinase